MREKQIRFFVISACAILMLTGAAKLISAFGNARILLANDSLLQISNRTVLISTAVIELLAVALVALSSRRDFQCMVLGFLGANFLLYRVAKLMLPFDVPCPCLGTLVSALHIDPVYAEWGLWTAALYLFAGGALGFYRMRISGAMKPYRRATEAIA